MLEVTTPAIEQKLGVDFAEVYDNSEQFRFLFIFLCANGVISLTIFVFEE